MFDLNQQIEEKKISKENLDKKIENKKNMIKGMSSDSLDVDLLDEQSRKTLGYVGKDEIVIYKEDRKKKKIKKRNN